MTLGPTYSRLTIQYGSLSLVPSSFFWISSEYDQAEHWREWARSGHFEVEVHASVPDTGNQVDDDASLVSLVSAVEAAMVPRKRLLVTYQGAIVLDWNFAPTSGSPTQHFTAFLIRPSFRLVRDNGRDRVYKLSVDCEFPGNVVGNNGRRESFSSYTYSLNQRRIASVTAEWTAVSNGTGGTSDAVTALANYNSVGDDFFNAVLPDNSAVTDQWSNQAYWSLAEVRVGPWNDENSTIQVQRTYWEVFVGRQQSEITVETLPTSSPSIGVSRFDSRRVCRIPSRWAPYTTAPPDNTHYTALQAYLNNQATFFANLLPSNVASGEWVLVSATPTWSEEDPSVGKGVLTVVHEYREVIHGLWNYNVEMQANEFNALTLVISGVFYATASATAQSNYNSYISTLISGVVSASGITNVDAVSTPRDVGYGVTALEYHFRHTVHEICYKQSSSYDDNKILLETLDLRHIRPFDRQSIPSGDTVTRLHTITASFKARVDTKATGGLNPTAAWDSVWRAAVVGKITSLLGSDVSAVQVVEEEIGPLVGDQQNLFTGNLKLLVTNDGLLSILRIVMVQRVVQRPGRHPVGLGSGVGFEFQLYRRPPIKTLHREGMVEYVTGGSVPVLFDTGDLDVSGFSMVDPGINAQDDINNQNSASAYTLTANWFCTYFEQKDFPGEQGDGVSPFQTNIHWETQDWQYADSVTAP